MGPGGIGNHTRVDTTNGAGPIQSINTAPPASSLPKAEKAEKLRGIAGIKNPILKNVAQTLGAFATSAHKQITSFGSHINPLSHLNKQLNENQLKQPQSELRKSGDVNIDHSNGKNYLQLKQLNNSILRCEITATSKGFEVHTGSDIKKFANLESAKDFFTAPFDMLKAGCTLEKENGESKLVFTGKKDKNEHSVTETDKGFTVGVSNTHQKTFKSLKDASNYLNSVDVLRDLFKSNAGENAVTEKPHGVFYQKKYGIQVEVNNKGDFKIGETVYKRDTLLNTDGKLDSKNLETLYMSVQIAASQAIKEAQDMRDVLGQVF